jgi:sigma-B regulation protein RsbU (phosphoserine phosphatase)
VYVNAGHNPPLVLRRKGDEISVNRLEAGGMVIGLLPECSYEQGTFALEAGDLVVLFTDGISESMNGNDEEWGESG